MPKPSGLFITFEGPEGSGKSTQARLLAAWLRRQRRRVVVTHEPGGTPLGRAIRRLLLQRHQLQLTDEAELCLFMASRAQLVDEVIAPSLRRGAIVICDRFLDSTLAYQGGGSRLSLDAIQRMGQLVTRGVQPDLTILLDLPTAAGFRRLSRRRDRMEAKARRYHERVRRQYLALARGQPRRIIRLNAQQPMAVLQHAICAIVLRRLAHRWSAR